MKTITLDQVMDKNPCGRYSRAKIAKWFPGKRPRLRKLFDVALDNGVTHYDLVFHFVKYLGKKRYVFFACDCAERALKRVDCKDKRSWEAVRISRLYVQGKASKEDMDAAAADADAAYAAAYDAAAYDAAADDAAAYAAYAAADAADAAYAAADAADAADADATERKWQLNRLLEYLEEV